MKPYSPLSQGEEHDSRLAVEAGLEPKPVALLACLLKSTIAFHACFLTLGRVALKLPRDYSLTCAVQILIWDPGLFAL